ncbi:hypothetical protein Hanom_Chr17g01577771 [Helianthus anomalus]
MGLKNLFHRFGNGITFKLHEIPKLLHITIRNRRSTDGISVSGPGRWMIGGFFDLDLRRHVDYICRF